MQGLLGGFSGRLKKSGNSNFIDNTTFRLHYRVTFTILVVSSLLTTTYQYIGAPIICMASGVPGGLMNTYCWIHGTFTVPAKLAGVIGENMPHPGVGPTTDPNLIRITEEGDEIRHAWYQWVCFVLFLQALMCYVPHYLWKTWEGGKIKMMIQDLNEQKLNEEDPNADATRKERRLATVQYFERTKGSHQLYVSKYVFCEALNLANVVLQLYLMNFFLGGQFFDYGMDVLRVSELPIEERVDPMSKVFPKVTKCTFNNYGPSGTVENKDGLCVLAINIINEKIYIFLWFWFLTLCVWTGVHLFIRILSMALVNFRMYILSNRTKGSKRSDLSIVVRKCAYGDFFLLMQLSKHFDPNVFHEFIIDLRDRLMDKRDEMEMQD